VYSWNGTHTDVRGNELSKAEGPLHKTYCSVESDEYDACNEAIRGFQPLPMGFVGISWMVTIVTCSLSFGSISISLDLFQSKCDICVSRSSEKGALYIRFKEAEVSGADDNVHDQTRHCAIRCELTQSLGFELSENVIL
jgi:hypothetical protein